MTVNFHVPHRSVTVKLMPAKHRHYVKVRRVDECSTLDEIFTHCLPAFGGAYLRRISVRLVRKKEERSCTLDWNPVLKVLELPLCEHCSARAHPIYLCERVHLLCKDCWVHCPRCSRFFCRVCQKECRCGREPVARGSGKV